MSIPSRLSSYLDQLGVRYEVCPHEHSHSSAESARRAQVLPHQLAKPVVLEDEVGCVMAVVPGDRSVMLGEVARMLGRRELHLSDEARIASLFADCERGAVPPVGMAWGIDTIVDEELGTSDVVYLEGGDHENLLRMSQEQFHELMSAARHGHFCKTPTH
jgi:Ala-tRNA(Pro) deacylase